MSWLILNSFGCLLLLILQINVLFECKRSILIPNLNKNLNTNISVEKNILNDVSLDTYVYGYVFGQHKAGLFILLFFLFIE